jgi:hypothetical protein
LEANRNVIGMAACGLASIVSSCASPGGLPFEDYLVVGGAAGAALPASSLERVAFSRDGKRWASIERAERGRQVVIVGEVGGAVRRRYEVAGEAQAVAWAGDDRTSGLGRGWWIGATWWILPTGRTRC